MNFHGGDIYNLNRELLDFSSNINPLGVPLSYRKALIDNIDDFIKYPDIKYTELRKSIAKYLGIENIDYIVPGNGAVEIIYKVVDALKIREVIIAAPTFSEYRRAAYVKGLCYEEIEVYNEKGSLMLDKFFTKLKSNSLYVICNPNNPTGTLTNVEKLSSFAKQLYELDSYLLVDEAFIEFTDEYPNNSTVSKLYEHPNVIVVRAATKFFGMPGIRLGYGISFNEDLISAMKNRLEPWNINTSGVIAECIFRDQDYISRSREWISKERGWLYNELKGIRGLSTYPTSANFFLIKILKDNFDGEKFKEMMIKKDILIRTSEGFTHLSPFHIRVAIKNRKSNERLILALKDCVDI
ncbi:pyridoxal phosphate-dependent aminotransferase [Serpentinicella alkaliphila]|uniref:Threonine-phosphate decarboxylase n=1 Tax=Serpentinicella alkaliphila TaxID=1734049 RepID=A0A4R2TS34_9FIRM|nr:histidinol-phosphate transaminase [Serpentinicella alkaliphila]QUH24431.1 aminotransferase class I/II-fold pyridoxal phosphate-dependent enzyme [Serpentinicella alkaliphila]TCQ04175.1 threonine-phosphate decarboxylase [Serpentinicella alkaliphila]